MTDPSDTPVTKGDLEKFGTVLRSELRGEMSELRSELRGEMSELRSELRGEMSELRGEFGELRASHESFAVRIENIVERNLQAITEALLTNRDVTDRQINELDERLGGRIKLLEEAVKSLSQSVRALEVEVQGLRRDFDAERARNARDAAALHRLEARVDVVEQDVANLKAGRNDR